MHRGYQLCEIFNEVYGEYERDWVLHGMNHQLVRSFESYYECQRSRTPQNPPYLVRARREDAPRALPTVNSGMFAFVHPRIGYTFKQQDVLNLAMEAMKDEEIAKALGIPEETVSKRWQAIFRLSGSDTEVLGAFARAQKGLKGPSTRKRTILLKILEQRKEELRPWHWPTDVRLRRSKTEAS